MDEIKCPVCEPSRLKRSKVLKKIYEKNITELVIWTLDLTAWFNNLDTFI
jgi:excinuclease ABC subunit A